MGFFGIAVVVFVVLCAIAIVVQGRGARSLPVRSKTAPLPAMRSVFTLQIGDFVQFDDAAWAVEGRLVYDSKGYEWLEYLLQDGDAVRWLSVEEDDRVVVCWLEPVTDLAVVLDRAGNPPPTLVFQGETYRCTESGQATMRRTGTTLNRQAEACRFYDYEGPSGRVLSVEVWDGTVEVTAGRTIHPRSLSLLPGDGRSVHYG